jgi:hypothetical protein
VGELTGGSDRAYGIIDRQRLWYAMRKLGGAKGRQRRRRGELAAVQKLDESAQHRQCPRQRAVIDPFTGATG